MCNSQVPSQDIIVLSSETVDITDPILSTSHPGIAKSHTDILGIRQIWVSSSYRNQGIASLLVDTARSKYWIGNIVERCNIAFSQPTVMGLSFAKSYVGLDYILVYR